MRIEPTPEIDVYANDGGGITIKVINHDLCNEAIVAIPIDCVERVIQGLRDELEVVMSAPEELRSKRPPSPPVMGKRDPGPLERPRRH